MERGIQEFDAWAANFGDTRTELKELATGWQILERKARFIDAAMSG